MLVCCFVLPPALVKTETVKSYWIDCLYVNVIFFFFNLEDTSDIHCPQRTTPTDSGDLLNVYL